MQFMTWSDEVYMYIQAYTNLEFIVIKSLIHVLKALVLVLNTGSIA